MGITILFKLVDDLETGSFFHLKPKAREENEMKEEETPIEPESKTEGEQMEESPENADIASETSESEDTTEENTSEETSEKPSPEDIAFAEVLGLSIEEIGKIEDLKSIYRKRIAQYHQTKFWPWALKFWRGGTKGKGN